MADEFYFKVGVSGLLGGLWIILTTVFGEKLGSKVGGLVTGLPSTAIFGLAFLGLTNGVNFAVASTTIMPAGIAIENFYIVIFILLARYGLVWALGASLVYWFASAYILVASGVGNYYFLSVVGYIVSTVIAFYITEKLLGIKASLGRPVKYTPKIILTRGFLGGLAVASIVFIGTLGGSGVGGVVAVFPTLISSTMIITHLSHGYEFAVATMKSVIPGLSGLFVYSALVRFTYLPLGIFWGTLVAVTLSVLWGYVLFRFVVLKTK